MKGTIHNILFVLGRREGNINNRFGIRFKNKYKIQILDLHSFLLKIRRNSICPIYINKRNAFLENTCDFFFSGVIYKPASGYICFRNVFIYNIEAL